MKSAEKWFSFEELGSILEVESDVDCRAIDLEQIRAIQDDAYEQGLRHAAEVVEKTRIGFVNANYQYGAMKCRDAILAKLNAAPQP